MEKKIINPWQWQDSLNYVQAVEVKNVAATLYCAGQAAVHADGTLSNADMKTQLLLAISNLEQLIKEAGYQVSNIVRLNILTTSSEELWPVFDVLQNWISLHGIKQATTLFEVSVLTGTLKIELEATAVK